MICIGNTNSHWWIHETADIMWDTRQRHMMTSSNATHDDVIKWKHFPRYWLFVRGIHRSPVNSPHKGQWRGALMFSLICTRINGWVNNREAGDLARHYAYYDVIVMVWYMPTTIRPGLAGIQIYATVITWRALDMRWEFHWLQYTWVMVLQWIVISIVSIVSTHWSLRIMTVYFSNSF